MSIAQGMGGAEPAGDDRVREVRPASAVEPSGRALRARKACRSRCRPWPTRWARSARRSIRSGALSRPMSWRPSACMATTRPCPCWRRARPTPGRCWVYVRDDKPFGGAGPPAAIFYYSRDRRGEHPQAHLAGYAGILQADAYDGYNKLYLAGPKARARSGRRRVGCMRGVRSSPWPTSRRTPGARRRARRRSRCRRSRSRSCAASTRCSRSSARSTARAPRSAWRFDKRRAGLWSTISMTYMREQVAKLVARARSRQGDPLHAQALAGLHAVPRRRARLPLEQCRRARAARHCSRAENHGCSAGPIAAASAPPPCTASSSPPR